MIKEQKFSNIYEEYRPKISRLVLGYVHGDENLAKDLTQDIFIKVWDHLDTFKENASIGTWIYRIAINTCLMYLRTRRSYKKIDQIEIPDEPVDTKEYRYIQMYACIDELNTQDKSIILLTLEDLPQQEISEIMGMTHEAIRTRVHRIKIKLSKCVKNYG